MIKYKTRYRFSFKNLSEIIVGNIGKLFAYWFVISTPLFIASIFDSVMILVLVFPIHLYFTYGLMSYLIRISKEEGLPVFYKQIVEYEYKEKLIPYSKFEKKYKKTKKQQV